MLLSGRLAAVADLPSDGPPTLRYHPDYVADPSATPLSSGLVPQPGIVAGEGVGNWLAGLLPDDPRVLAALLQRHQIDPAMPSHLLGTAHGYDCAGAVQFSRPDRTADLLARQGGLDALEDHEVFSWLREIRTRPEYQPKWLPEGFGASLPGVQPKLALRLEGDQWHLPWGAEPSSHILKVARREYDHEALLQHLTLRISQRMGSAVPDTRVLQEDDLEVLAVERYDRTRDFAGDLVRLHQEDLCQALGLAPEQKFEAFGGPGADDVADHLRTVTDADAERALETWRDMLILQWLLAHNDMHGKNVSLLLAGSRCQIAPLYDVCSWLPYRAGSVEDILLAVKLGNSHRLAECDTPDALLTLAAKLKVPAKALAERCADLAVAVPGALRLSVASLDDQQQSLPIIEQYMDEQTSRSNHCLQVAEQAMSAAQAT